MTARVSPRVRYPAQASGLWRKDAGTSRKAAVATTAVRRGPGAVADHRLTIRTVSLVFVGRPGGLRAQ